MEAISILLFKPGFTIQSLNGATPQLYAIDENLVWKSGVTVLEATNHFKTEYDQNRICLLRLMICMLSQPLFHSPEEYLVILNPFNTFFTNRNCKNVKNLFISLVNVIISYDCTGYVSNSLFLTPLGYPLHECNRYSRRPRDANKPMSAPPANNDRV
jgi:hypothetical protein